MKSFILSIILTFCSVICVNAQTTQNSQMEKLTRGVVALPAENGGNFVSWRMLGTDPLTTTFDLLRDGEPIARNLGNRTNFVDAPGTSNSQYSVVVKVDGRETERTDAVKPWGDYFKSIKLERPVGGTSRFREWNDSENKYQDWQDNVPFSYFPSECCVGDVDGDGVYELIVRWDPSNWQPSSRRSGKTGNVYIDCYKVNYSNTESNNAADLLWRIDLGQNVRAGTGQNHVMVYDFDGDGRAEIIIKTAPGSKDGLGNYVNQAADEDELRKQDNTYDWRDENGKIRGGGEYLTVFEGLTGRAIHTIFYNPNRNAEYYTSRDYNGYGYAADGTFDWSDTNNPDKADYGNRGECYLACVAHLDGPDQNPSAVMCRGIYSYVYLWAVDFDGQKLSTKWLHDSGSKTVVKRTDANGVTESRTHLSNTFGVEDHDSYTAYGQGHHQVSVADVDGDGCDEIIYGAATIDNDGWLLYSTGLGHGDALHVSDLQPDRPGLEVFRCIEGKPYGVEMHDARTGEKLYYRTDVDGGDTGACVAANIDERYRGFEFWASDILDVCDANGNVISTNRPEYHTFRTFWDGDLQDELLTWKGAIDKWNGNGTTRIYLNKKNLYEYGNSMFLSSKHTPTLQADLFGDWREEIITWNGDDSTSINIFTTNIPSNYRVPTPMHDHVYRMGIAWQNVNYNMPPHLGYYLPDTDFSYPGEIPDEAAPDLSDYELKKELDFSNMVDTYITTTYPNDQKGTAWETGNKKQQKLYNTTSPEDWHDWLAFQATYSGSGTKGWWVSQSAGGLVTEGATRSAAVLDLKKGDIVIIESTNSVDGTLTITNGNGQPDGSFTYSRSDDGSKYYCTMTADGQIGFCGTHRYSGAIKSIRIYQVIPTVKYKVVEMADGKSLRTTEGEAKKGTIVSVPYHLYNVVDGTLYKRPASGGSKGLEYNHYFTLSTDGQTETLEYENTGIEGVVFLCEGEDISGMTPCTSANAGVRSSNAAAAYAANGNVPFVTLSSGIYRLSAVIFDGSTAPDSYWNFLAADKEVTKLHCTKTNFEELQSEPFVLTTETPLSIVKGGNYRSGIDLVYIVRTGDTPSGIEDIHTLQSSASKYYTLDGRPLAGKPQNKGIYMNNGRKIIVK